MKLSELKGDEVFDILADLMPPMTNIALDPEAAKLFERRPLPEGMTPTQFGYQWLAEASNKLLKKHKKDCIAMLAVATGVSQKQYKEELTFEKLIMDLVDLMGDPVFQTLFFSAMQGSSSGSAPASTEATAS